PDTIFAIPPFAPEVWTDPGVLPPNPLNPQIFPTAAIPMTEPTSENEFEEEQQTANVTIRLERFIFNIGDIINTYIDGVTQEMHNVGAFVAIYEAGAPHHAYTTYDYPAVGSGVHYFMTPSYPGEFEMRFYKQDFVYTDETFVTSVFFIVQHDEPAPVDEPHDFEIGGSYFFVSESGLSYSYLMFYDYGSVSQGEFYMDGNFTGEWGLDIWGYFYGQFSRSGNYIFLTSDDFKSLADSMGSFIENEMVFEIAQDGSLIYRSGNFGILENGITFIENTYVHDESVYDYEYELEASEETPWWW
ncbi:MAG: hypothetical protein LBC86_08810, partial [Oscillospiraceae bacterium]|nr:hypothetical protein [Oscillospiraceae bacterium]